MPHYKNTENDVRWLDSTDEEAEYLPKGFVQITDTEADDIREAKRIASFENLSYADKRASEYPLFADQFDLLYHSGFDAWKAAIQAVKDKYPKD
jgi:hypothetical protein